MLQARKTDIPTLSPRVARVGRGVAPEPLDAPHPAAPPPRAEPQPRAVPLARAPAPQKSKSSLRMASVYVAVAAALVIGWATRDAGLIEPDSDVSYWLGVTGGSLMLLLLLYPLRKHLARMRWMGPTRHWFKLHMTLGLVGPLLILYHCDFHFGATNSNVALICMLAVAVSGLVGRYIYAKIHHGLYGTKASLKELREELEDSQKSRTPNLFPELFGRLQEITSTALTAPDSAWHGAGRALVWSVKKFYIQHSIMRGVKRELRQRIAASPALAEHRAQIERDARSFVGQHLAAVRKVAEFTFYERLFALWHVFHLPMFLVMVVAALVHVLYVHMY
jgi:hypothetical protein